MLRLFFILCTLCASSALGAQETVREFRGTGNSTTAIFTVDSPWLLDWRLDGDFATLVALDISLIDADTGRHIGRVLHTKRIGNGLKLFENSGRYQLRVSSTLARWTVKIKKIEPDDVKLYTPRSKVAS